MNGTNATLPLQKFKQLKCNQNVKQWDDLQWKILHISFPENRPIGLYVGEHGHTDTYK